MDEGLVHDYVSYIYLRSNHMFGIIFESEMDAHGEPSALSIVRRWRAQRLEEEERNLQHEKKLIALQDHVRGRWRHQKQRRAALWAHEKNLRRTG